MDLDKVEYSSKPVTLEQRIWLERSGNGSYEAMFNLILARSNISTEEALELLEDDLTIVVTKIGEGMRQSYVLSTLGKAFQDG